MRLVVVEQGELEALIARFIEPLRLELERLRDGGGEVLVSYSEAARRLGLSLRSIQQRARDGRIQVEVVGGIRMARLPSGICAGDPKGRSRAR